MTVTRTDRALVIHPDGSVRREIESALRRVSNHPVAARHAASAGVALQVAREHDPRIVLLDLEHERAVSLAVAKELRRSGRFIIGLLNPLLQGDGSAEFLRHAVRSGVNEFVALPLADAELAAAMESLPDTEGVADEGRAIAFFGHQGGVGTTSLAINCAFAIATERRRVALLDANVQFGSVAAQLGVVPENDLSHAIRDVTVGAVLPLTVVGRDPSIAIAASPSDFLAAESISPQELGRILIELRRSFDTVVVDTAPVLDALALVVLDLCESVVVVTEPNSPTIAGTGRLLRMLADLGFNGRRVRLVINKYRSASDVVPPEIVAEQLGHEVDHVIPFVAPVAAAAHRGVPALFERAAVPFREPLLKLAKDISRKEGRA